jgi:tetratricopeptide (TPR) repeat protein
MELTDEAKELIAREFEALAKKTNDTLQELKIYRWALRIIFALLFGGTVLGVLKLQDYLDRRIEERSEELSGIVYGNVAQAAGDLGTAIEQYSDVLDKLDNAVFRPSESIRSIYYFRFIQALAYDNQTDPDGEFAVNHVFLSLLRSKSFKKDRLQNEKSWRSDPVYLDAWAMCLVKFGESVQEIESAYVWFEAAAKEQSRPNGVASSYFAMAMVALARGNEDDARALIQKSAAASPKSHGIEVYSGELSEDLQSEYQVWERSANKLQKPGIASRYSKVMQSLIVEHQAKNRSTTTP